ncbi:MAG: hypothetical protein ACXACI_01120 [Candidatus Hodarchaeales archaeon]|jgi:hypothetical protein
MAKDKEILDKITGLEDKISNIEFLVVQMMGGGGPVPTPSASASTSVPAGPVSVDLAPINQALERIEEVVASKSDFAALRTDFQQLSSGKVAQAEDVINKVTILLEKGLQMTELETTLLEIKDRLEELIIQLSAVEQQASEG